MSCDDDDDDFFLFVLVMDVPWWVWAILAMIALGVWIGNAA